MANINSRYSQTPQLELSSKTTTPGLKLPERRSLETKGAHDARLFKLLNLPLNSLSFEVAQVVSKITRGEHTTEYEVSQALSEAEKLQATHENKQELFKKLSTPKRSTLSRRFEQWVINLLKRLLGIRSKSVKLASRSR